MLTIINLSIDVVFEMMFGGNGRNIIGVAPITQCTHMCDKNSNIQGRSLNVIKVNFHTIRYCS